MKAMRVFVESTLRFGVPANFSAFMVKPAKNKTKKYRVALDELFGASGLYGSQYNQTASNEQEGGEDYFSYVCVNLVPVTGGAQ